MLLALSGWPHFCVVLEAFVGLTVGVTIGGAESISKEVAIGFFGWSWWKILMSL